MAGKTATIRFSRGGMRDGQPLDRSCVYQVSIDGGPRSEFRSPWDALDLEEELSVLRNTDPDRPPDAERVRRIGKELAAETFKIAGFAEAVKSSSAIYWLLDYPELAKIPWELLTENQEPFRHLLVRRDDDGVSFVRKVTAAVEDCEAAWPSGRDEALRMLFVWGQRQDGDVPDKEHLAVLTEICDRLGIQLASRQVHNIQDLVDACGREDYHFVHILAHGARTENEQWGLRFSDRIVSGEQVADALRVNSSTPALVTVAACDSASDQNNTFGSVAYNLHVHGIPLVLASQFRLNKKTSTRSIASVYDRLLAGQDMIAVLEQTRRQLSPGGTEAWANEVLYSRYRHRSLTDMSVIASQQAALRRARVIGKKQDLDKDQAARDLGAELVKLRTLAELLQGRDEQDRGALAETYGLIGSIVRRQGALQGLAGDAHLRMAAREYLTGFRIDRNSHYCAINVVHLYKRLGMHDEADALIPMVRFTVEAEIATGNDFWASATAGELEVYAGDAHRAVDHYTDFFAEVMKRVSGDDQKRDTIQTPVGQLGDIEGDDDFSEVVRRAAGTARENLEQNLLQIPANEAG